MSCSVLRGLLPTFNNPAKKFKLEMASLYEIASLIAEDWEIM